MGLQRQTLITLVMRECCFRCFFNEPFSEISDDAPRHHYENEPLEALELLVPIKKNLLQVINEFKGNQRERFNLVLSTLHVDFVSCKIERVRGPRLLITLRDSSAANLTCLER